MLTVSVVVTGTYLMVRLSRTPDSGDHCLIPILLESMLVCYNISIYILSVYPDLGTVSKSVLIDKCILIKMMLLYLSAYSPILNDLRGFFFFRGGESSITI